MKFKEFIKEEHEFTHEDLWRLLDDNPVVGEWDGRTGYHTYPAREEWADNKPSRIGYNSHHTIHVYNHSTPVHGDNEYTKVMTGDLSDYLKQKGIKHEVAQDENNKHTIYVPVNQHE